jgi:hypothetical protein
MKNPVHLPVHYCVENHVAEVRVAREPAIFIQEILVEFVIINVSGANSAPRFPMGKARLSRAGTY